MAQEQPQPIDVLIKAKLAGTISPSSVPMLYTYLFRDNEQAAELAIKALEEAGYKIVPNRVTIDDNLYKDGVVSPEFRVAETIKELPTGDLRGQNVQVNIHEQGSEYERGYSAGIQRGLDEYNQGRGGS